MARYLALSAAVFALLPIAASGVDAQQSTNSVAAPPDMAVQISEESNQFTIKNIGDDRIDDLKITTYPPPNTRSDGTVVILVGYAFRKTVGVLGKNEIAVVPRDELRNNNNAALSNSKYKVGAIMVTGKIAGRDAGGELFTGQGGNWGPVPAETKMDASLMLLLGPMDEPF